MKKETMVVDVELMVKQATDFENLSEEDWLALELSHPFSSTRMCTSGVEENLYQERRIQVREGLEDWIQGIDGIIEPEESSLDELPF